MRVLLTCPSLADHGGVAGYYISLLPFMRTGGIEVTVLEIGSTAARSQFLHPLVDLVRVFFSLYRKRFDLVHVNPSFNFKSFIRDGLLVLAAKLRGKPVLVFFRGWQKAFEQVVRRWLLPFFSLTYKQEDAFIFLGETFAERLREWGISHPIHLETTAAEDRLLDGFSIEEKLKLYNGSGIKLLFLSSLLKQKGIFELLEAVVILRQRYPGITLSVAGNGPEFRRVKEAVHTMSLENTVTLLGHVSGAHKAAVFSSHHIFCFPSWDEGMPNCVLEAMAFGLPIVATSVGALSDFFVEGRMGRFVPVRDPTGLAAGIY